MLFDLVAFDCDGVIVDTEPVVNRVFLRTIASEGPVIDEQESLVRFTGAAMDARIATIRAEHGWTPSPDFESRYEAALDEALKTELRLIPGVDAVVRAVTGPRCVVSNGSRHEITEKLRLTGLLDVFAPNLFSATELPRRKPHPDVYLHAASRMGVAPERAAAVEDSAPGVTAARAAGFTVFGYAATTSARELERLGARVFSHMNELPALLGF
jgi:HAD superfamily hydrolase (TIGR01509 family)